MPSRALAPGGAFGPLVVWSTPRAGEYDLLALRAADRSVAAGEDLGSVPGLVALQILRGPPSGPLVLGALGLAALAGLRLERRKARSGLARRL